MLQIHGQFKATDLMNRTLISRVYVNACTREMGSSSVYLSYFFLLVILITIKNILRLEKIWTQFI